MSPVESIPLEGGVLFAILHRVRFLIILAQDQVSTLLVVLISKILICGYLLVGIVKVLGIIKR